MAALSTEVCVCADMALWSLRGEDKHQNYALDRRELWGNCGAGRSRLSRSDVGSRSGYVQEKRLEGCRHSLGNTLEEVVKGEHPRLRR
ncbi:hypothetical protein CFAM422_005951 [Trichoderma lentiforme]|uniref:Uncharacterized protein n=1 Tax=Trichoderma lentiforme TaxID=1567552 RepID=A0A9P4XFZ3_9HYPO|nr:hypothetical protein CFAM422_005951 [Trichoderma lentiforme]